MKYLINENDNDKNNINVPGICHRSGDNFNIYYTILQTSSYSMFFNSISE